MDAEKKQQLYGGEISDYLPKPKHHELKNDYQEIEKIYLNLKRKSFGLNSSNDLNDKLK